MKEIVKQTSEKPSKALRRPVRLKFKSTIKRGTGEAHILMENNPDFDFTNDIVNAALKNNAFDEQSEGTRAEYIYDLTKISGNEKEIKDAVLKALATQESDMGALEQLFDLAAMFAFEGDENAKKAVYKRYFKKLQTGSEHVGEQAILAIDGIEGLKHIAETKGKFIKSNKSFLETSKIADRFQEENPSVKVYKELEKAAGTNPAIKIYLDVIRNNKSDAKKTDKKSAYDKINELITSGDNVIIPKALINELSKSEIVKIADDFLAEVETERKEMYLQVFALIEFPYSYKPLLKLAGKKNAIKDKISEYACKSLQFFSGPDIRKFAITKLKDSTYPFQYFDLLVSNYKAGDSVLLTKFAKYFKHIQTVHMLAKSYIKIYNANNTAECEAPLLALYENLTCGICRADILKILIKNKVIPAQIKKEIKYDSYAGVRTLYKGK